jgi:hypothetical protein
VKSAALAYAGEAEAKRDAAHSLVLSGLSPAAAAGLVGLLQLSEADYGDVAGRWREQYRAGGAHRVMVLAAGAEWTRPPARPCSYCRADVAGIRCGNCGAPVTGSCDR